MPNERKTILCNYVAYCFSISIGTTGDNWFFLQVDCFPPTRFEGNFFWLKHETRKPLFEEINVMLIIAQTEFLLSFLFTNMFFREET